VARQYYSSFKWDLRILTRANSQNSAGGLRVNISIKDGQNGAVGVPRADEEMLPRAKSTEAEARHLITALVASLQEDLRFLDAERMNSENASHVSHDGHMVPGDGRVQELAALVVQQSNKVPLNASCSKRVSL
jgi:hypothetical protein